jgi:hypothetical protein
MPRSPGGCAYLSERAPLPIGLKAKDPGGELPVVVDLTAADEPEGRARERVACTMCDWNGFYIGVNAGA